MAFVAVAEFAHVVEHVELAEDVGGSDLVAPGFIAVGFRGPVDDHRPVADFAEAGDLIKKSSFLNAGHSQFGTAFGEHGFELVGLDLHSNVIFGDNRPVGIGLMPAR